MYTATYRCPYCFDEFKYYPMEGDATEMAPDCGHHFTMGEARRGRPDPANQDEVTTLTERIEHLEAQVAGLMLSVDILNAIVGRTFPAWSPLLLDGWQE